LQQKHNKILAEFMAVKTKMIGLESETANLKRNLEEKNELFDEQQL